MAGTTVPTTVTGMAGSDVEQMCLAFNRLVDDVEVLRAGLNTLATNFNAALAKLDADAGVTDTNYNSTQAVVRTTYDAAGDLTAPKVANQAGATT